MTAALLAQLRRAREEILAAAEEVPPQRRGERFLGEWSLFELVAHLTGWDYTNVEALAAIRAGRLPSFYEAYDPDWASFNANLVRRYRRSSWQETVEAARRSLDSALQAFASLPEEELARDRGLRWRGRRITPAGIMRAAVRDEEEHARQVRAFAASSRAL